LSVADFHGFSATVFSCVAARFFATQLGPEPRRPQPAACSHLFDLAVGDDNLFRGEKYKWSLRLSAINVTNREALSNFLSTFSGTHYLTSRSYTAEVEFHF